MRKHVAIHAVVFLLLLVVGTLAHRSIRSTPAVIQFEPVHVEDGGGENPPLPARRGRAPLPAKRRVMLPPKLALNEHRPLALRHLL